VLPSKSKGVAQQVAGTDITSKIQALVDTLDYPKTAKITDEVTQARKQFVENLLNLREDYLKVPGNSLESWLEIAQPQVDARIGKAQQSELGWLTANQKVG
jgi:hypothetical protein